MSRITHCRSCGSPDLSVVLDLGLQPIANALVDRGAEEPEDRFPLEVAFCGACALVQVTETIPPAVLFGRDYPYYSSTSKALLEHSRSHAEQLIASRRLGRSSFVVEVASNDGYLLQNFVREGVPVLGVDPAEGPAADAVASGVPTRVGFFDPAIAAEIVNAHGPADVILANNVLAHVDAINAFVRGFSILLKQGGIAQFEFPYLRDLIESCAFDTIYHEHVFYYSLTALEPLFNRHGLNLVDAERIDIHGGSLRLTVAHEPGRSARLDALLAQEAALGMDRLPYYQNFSREAEGVRERLQTLVRDLKAEGARVCAYGAAAKGATLLNFAQLDKGDLDYVVDLNPHKVGKLMPGVGLPVRPVDALTDDRPDYLLILVWNFAREVMDQQKAFAESGGRFVLPIPTPHVVHGASASLRNASPSP